MESKDLTAFTERVTCRSDELSFAIDCDNPFYHHQKEASVCPMKTLLFQPIKMSIEPTLNSTPWASLPPEMAWFLGKVIRASPTPCTYHAQLSSFTPQAK
jgi:hypothetical protein